MDIEKIRKLATEFRTAIERTSKHEFFWRTSMGAGDFPSAFCDDASILLAAYFSDNLLPGALRISGTCCGSNDELQRHIWLSLEGIIIDITADQFNHKGHSLEKVIVTEASEFHASFRTEKTATEQADFRIKYGKYPDAESAHLENYEVILSKI